MKNTVLLYLGLAFITFGWTQETMKRTIVTTDGEIDDVDTFIRYLLYSNEFDTQGLIYSSSMWHWKGDDRGTKFTSEMEMTKNIYGENLTDLRWPGTQWIQELLAEYAVVYPNLLLHDERYPAPQELLDLVRVGNIDFEGDMAQRTEGSELIKEKLLDDDDRDLFLQAWGGTNTIARALKSIEEDYKDTRDWKAIKEKVSKKAIIYTLKDQESTHKN